MVCLYLTRKSSERLAAGGPGGCGGAICLLIVHCDLRSIQLDVGLRDVTCTNVIEYTQVRKQGRHHRLLDISRHSQSMCAQSTLCR